MVHYMILHNIPCGSFTPAIYNVFAIAILFYGMNRNRKNGCTHNPFLNIMVITIAIAQYISGVNGPIEKINVELRLIFYVNFWEGFF